METFYTGFMPQRKLLDAIHVHIGPVWYLRMETVHFSKSAQNFALWKCPEMKQERSGKNCQFQMYRWSKYIFNSLQYLLRMLTIHNYSKAMQTGSILGSYNIFTNKRDTRYLKCKECDTYYKKRGGYLKCKERDTYCKKRGRILKKQGMRYLLQEKSRIPKMQGMRYRYLMQEKRKIPKMQGMRYLLQEKRRIRYLKCK